ncbi:hypothetical protein CTEN210_18299 [Chaetoceros tenuissimus]|uniref:Uncharacterized protein n=1 Tax=Chaetoceros tenuissimus TaxID=426638 RepID=A0AAD3DCF8_9STRA|nr:hypothetical protein CTEN210_18299 [Chaetoceros tenuissimus]
MPLQKTDVVEDEDELRIVGSLLRRKSIQKQSSRDIYTTKSFSSVAAIKKKKILLTRKTSDLPEIVDSDEEEQTFVSTLTRESSSRKKSIYSIASAQWNKIVAIVLLIGVILLISLASPRVSPIHDFREQSQSSRILRSQQETLHLEDTIAKATKRMKDYNQLITKFQQGNKELLDYHNLIFKEKIAAPNNKTNNKVLQLRQEGIKQELSNLEKVHRLHERQIRAMMDKIQRDSYRDVFEKFGKGPHSIEFMVSSSEKGIFTPVILELVSLQSMPLSVHLFLEQVYHNLWSGISIHNIDGKVLETDVGSHIKDFESLGLSTIHFEEANVDMPNFTSQDHAQYVCFKDQGPNLQFFNWSVDEALKNSKTNTCFAKISRNEDNASIFETRETIFIERSRIMNLRMHTGLGYTADSSREMQNKHFS